jgi:hypothetical protein
MKEKGEKIHGTNRDKGCRREKKYKERRRDKGEEERIKTGERRQENETGDRAGWRKCKWNQVGVKRKKTGDKRQGLGMYIHMQKWEEGRRKKEEGRRKKKGEVRN